MVYLGAMTAAPTNLPRRRGRPRRDATAPCSESVIRQAALAAFAEKGFDGTVLRDIAARAQVDVSLIAYVFGSKLGLWKAVVVELRQSLLAELSDALGGAPETDAAARLRSVLMAFVDFTLGRPQVAGFLLREFSHDPKMSAWSRDQLTKPYLDFVVPVMAQAAEAGALRSTSHELAALTFGIGVVTAVARRELLSAMQPRLGDDATFRASLRETLVETILA